MIVIVAFKVGIRVVVIVYYKHYYYNIIMCSFRKSKEIFLLVLFLAIAGRKSATLRAEQGPREPIST